MSQPNSPEIAIGVCTAALKDTNSCHLGATVSACNPILLVNVLTTSLLVTNQEYGFAWVFGQQARQHAGISHKYPNTASESVNSNLVTKNNVIGVKLDFRQGSTTLCYYRNGTPLGVAFANSNSTNCLSFHTFLVKQEYKPSAVTYFPAVSVMNANDRIELRSTELLYIHQYMFHLDKHDM